MDDVFQSAAIPSARLEVAIALSTNLCRTGQLRHELAATSAVALGRLLTASALVELSSKRRGSTSFQILTQGRMRQVFADHSHEGHGRGFARHHDLAFPETPAEKTTGRRAVSPAILPGKLHVVRANEAGKYTHSTTALVTGEVDSDVEHFLEQSDQVPTALACDVLLGGRDAVARAGGILVQCLPGGNLERLRAAKEAVAEGGFAKALERHGHDLAALLTALAPDAVPVAPPRPILWRCRCSRARVLEMLRVLSPAELAEMVAEDHAVTVSCDLCTASYEISLPEIEAILALHITAQG